MRYRDKLDWVRKYAQGRKTLYLGSVDDNPGNTAKHDQLFEAIRAFAGEATAVYHSAEETARLKAAGQRVVHGDPEQLDLGEEYEIILTLDNIEHMSNAGAFLSGVARHLREGGLLLVTTPNPLGFVRIGEHLLARRGKVNPEHTCWFTGEVLGQLAARYGLRIVDQIAIDDMYVYHRSRSDDGQGAPIRFARWLLRASNSAVCSLLPGLCETSGYLLEKRSARAE
jgi:SAM-dependent methyltransferase